MMLMSCVGGKFQVDQNKQIKESWSHHTQLKCNLSYIVIIYIQRQSENIVNM